MSAEKKCEDCGAAISPGATDGLCTQCLFSLGLDAPGTSDASPLPRDGAPGLAKTEETFGVKCRYFGDYELLEEIARGGMGVVFKARQIRLNRLAALKLISTGTLATEELVKRFKAEAEAAASLAHPNIVPIYEIGEHEGQHYFSMGLIDGPNLREALSETRKRKSEIRKRGEPWEPGGYEPKEAARLLAIIARAVHYAHQRGVLHRDIKPSNILLDGAGEPHLTDFGLAKLIEKESTLTHTNAVMGTPAYMSPEQARGETKEVTTAADVYGLGAVLYEALAGTPPFAGGTSLETIRQVLDEEPRHPSMANPKVDRDLDTICLKCLEKEPGQRYGSAEALADDLDRWLRHEPILARRASVFERGVKWSRRQPVLATALVLLQLVLALGVAGILWGWRESVLARRAEATERRRAVRAEAEAFALLNESKVNYARANRLTARPGQRFETLAELASVAAGTNRLDARNEAIACLVLPDLRPLKEWARTARWHSFKFNATFRRYATNDVSGNLTIRDTESDVMLAQVPVAGGSNIGPCAVFSPDERFVATIDAAGEGRVWDSSMQTVRLSDLPRGATLLAFAPDSKAVVVNYGAGSLHFLNPTNGADERAIAAPENPAWNSFQFDPSGEKFLICKSSEVVIRRASDGGHLMTLRLPEGARSGFNTAVWHPDGQRVACAWLNHIDLWDTKTGRQLGGFEGHEAWITGLAFTHRGEYLASASWDCTTRLWDSQTHREVLTLPDAGNELAFSTDDRRLSFQSWDDKQAKLYELPALSAGERIPLPPPARSRVHYTTQPVFSPDGELVVAPDKEGAYVFQGSNPAPVALLPVPASVCFAPDGKSLFTAGGNGAQRWPVKWTADRSEVNFGPPEVLEPTRGLHVSSIGLSSDGRWLVAQAQHTVLTLRVNEPSEFARFERSLRLSGRPSISPDGKWVTTVTPSLDRVQIWNGHTGKVVTNLPSIGAWQCTFSPDGYSMACAQKDSTIIRDTADWSVRVRIPHPPENVFHGVAFSPDSRMVAVFAQNWEVRLLKVATGEEIAAFPGGRLTTGVAFDFLGERLGVANETGYLQLWELRHVREQLASLNLDWDMPPYAPAETGPIAPRFRAIVHLNDSATLSKTAGK
jgi:WD40 repeat protein